MSRPRRPAFALEDAPILLAACALPWAFGGASPWAPRAAGFLLVLGAALALWRRGVAGVAAPRGWLLPAVLLGAFAFLQTVPLPPAAVRALSPGAARAYEEAFPGWPATPDALPSLERAALASLPPDLPPPPAESGLGRQDAEPAVAWRSWRPLSLSPDATREAAFWFLALLLGALTVLRRADDPAVRSAYRGVLFTLFVGLAAFGLLQAATWNGKMFWVSAQPGRPFGPYLNGTHFAGAMEIACPWMAGHLVALLRRDGAAAWSAPRAIAAAAALAVCTVAGLAAQSKMGALLIAVALTIVGLGAARTPRARWAALAAAAAVWALGAAVVFAGPLGERFRSQLLESGIAVDRDRLAAWSACVPMMRDFPWVGSGIGAFRNVFPRYLPAGETEGWLQAHNDWLEVALGGGVAASILVVTLAGGFVRRAVAAIRELDRRGERSERRGLLVGLAALAVHAFVDFNHQLPANALLFTLAASLAAAPAARARGRSSP